MTVLFIQGSKWFTSSDVHSWNLPEGNEHQSQNEHTSKYPSQIDALYQMKGPSEKTENNIIR